MSDHKQTVHGIELTQTYWPPRANTVRSQWAGTIRGRDFTFIQRESQGGTYTDWEAHEYIPGTQSFKSIEFARQLGTIVSLVIETVERESMDRLNPKDREGNVITFRRPA